MPNQKTMWTRCLGGFSVMWVTKLLISPVKKRIFCPKTTKFGPKLAFLVNLGQAMQAYSMPCCGSVGGCGARAVSRKTPIYFIYKTQNRDEEMIYNLLQPKDGQQILSLSLSLSLTFSSFSKINTCTTPEFKCLHRIGRRYGIFSKTICFGQLPTQFLGSGIQNLKTRLGGNPRNLNNQGWNP